VLVLISAGIKCQYGRSLPEWRPHSNGQVPDLNFKYYIGLKNVSGTNALAYFTTLSAAKKNKVL